MDKTVPSEELMLRMLREIADFWYQSRISDPLEELRVWKEYGMRVHQLLNQNLPDEDENEVKNG